MSRESSSITSRPSLEALVEAGVVELESLHPGGLALTRRLAELCNVSEGTRLLDVACGTGETACYLAETFGADVCGLDRSDQLLTRARVKAAARGLNVEFRAGDAEALPFVEGRFDVVICECTLCLLDKITVLREMTRVVRSGGSVGMHDLFWQENAPARLKDQLREAEDEEPETVEEWRRLFASAGLFDVRAVDESSAKSTWMRDQRRKLGLRGQLNLGLFAVRRWGFSGLRAVLRSERVFSSPYLGYCIVTGIRP